MTLLIFLNLNHINIKIVIARNHDVTLQVDQYKQHFWRFPHDEKGSLMLDAENLKKQLSSKFIYLEDSEVNINGIKFYGMEWTHYIMIGHLC